MSLRLPRSRKIGPESASAVPFYSRPGLQVEIYDLQTETEWGRRQKDAAFYGKEARRSSGPVLELACGTARVATALLETGLEIHGLDRSRAMLTAAKARRAALPKEVRQRLHLHFGDMEDFELEQRFALILIPFRSFQILLTTEAQKRCLQCIRRHLVPGGRVIINIFDPRYDMLLPGRHQNIVPPREFSHPVSANHIVVETLERNVDPATQTFQEQWRFTERNSKGVVTRREEESLRLRWTFRHEMRLLVESCGFKVEAEYSDFQRSPPAYGKEQVWVLEAPRTASAGRR